MSNIRKYDYIRLNDADNGVTVSFDIIKKEEGDSTFDEMRHNSKEYVFGMDKLDDAFTLVKELMMYNLTKKKGETVTPVTLPS